MSARSHFYIFLAIVALFVCSWFLWRNYYKADNYGKNIYIKNTMLISSPFFSDNSEIPSEFTCSGKDAIPDLAWHNVPENARSLALIMEDPDAPGGTYTHWLAWNINPATGQLIGENLSGEIVQGRNSSGQIGYMGPCPPPGNPHRYYFRIFALDAELNNLKPGSDKAELEKAMEGRILDQGELMGTYKR